MIAGLCESPLTFQAITVWRDELLDEAIMLRDVIDLETTFSGQMETDEVESVLSGLKAEAAAAPPRPAPPPRRRSRRPSPPRAEARAGAARRRRGADEEDDEDEELLEEEEEEAPRRAPIPTRRRTRTRATCRSRRWRRR